MRIKVECGVGCSILPIHYPSFGKTKTSRKPTRHWFCFQSLDSIAKSCAYQPLSWTECLVPVSVFTMVYVPSPPGLWIYSVICWVPGGNHTSNATSSGLVVLRKKCMKEAFPCHPSATVLREWLFLSYRSRGLVEWLKW